MPGMKPRIPTTRNASATTVATVWAGDGVNLPVVRPCVVVISHLLSSVLVVCGQSPVPVAAADMRGRTRAVTCSATGAQRGKTERLGGFPARVAFVSPSAWMSGQLGEVLGRSEQDVEGI